MYRRRNIAGFVTYSSFERISVKGPTTADTELFLVMLIFIKSSTGLTD